MTNKGKVFAAEVAQLYLRVDGVKALRGFEKLWLQPGETKIARFSLKRKDVSRWDADQSHWFIPDSTLHFEAGKDAGHTEHQAQFRFT